MLKTWKLLLVKEIAIGEMGKKTKKLGNKFDDTYNNTKNQTDRIDKLNKKIK